MEHSTNDDRNTTDGRATNDGGDVQAATHRRTATQTVDMSHIKGWAIDANPRNEPSYPMRHRLQDSAEERSWQRPTQQTITTEVLHSNERPSMSAVFGTSAPPTGLSGAIRRFAFRYSEGTFTHWLSLLIADRVNMLEGLVNDLSQGHMPNFIAEKGLKAQWQYNRPAVIKKAAITVAVVGVAVYFLTRKRTKN